MNKNRFGKFIKITLGGFLIGTVTYFVAKYMAHAILLYITNYSIKIAIAFAILESAKLSINYFRKHFEEKKQKRFEIEPDKIVYCEWDDVFVS